MTISSKTSASASAEASSSSNLASPSSLHESRGRLRSDGQDRAAGTLHISWCLPCCCVRCVQGKRSVRCTRRSSKSGIPALRRRRHERYISGHNREKVSGLVDWAQRPDDPGWFSSYRGTSGGRNRGEFIGRLAACFQRHGRSGVCLAHPHNRRNSLGAAAGHSLYFRWCVPVVSSCGRLGVTHARTRDLPACRRSLGTYLVVPAPPHAGLGLAAIRRNHHPHPCHHDLEDLAFEHRMGYRHACGDQHALQRNLSPDAFSSRAQHHEQVGLGVEGHPHQRIQLMRALRGIFPCTIGSCSDPLSHPLLNFHSHRDDDKLTYPCARSTKPLRKCSLSPPSISRFPSTPSPPTTTFSRSSASTASKPSSSSAASKITSASSSPTTNSKAYVTSAP